MAKIIKKISPHDRRIQKFSSQMSLVEKTYEDPLYRAHIERTMRMDIDFNLKYKNLVKKIPLFILLCSESSSGFRMANLLRHYFSEYANRVFSHGPQFLPTSFNVIEAFFELHNEFGIFVLRKEREHLLRLHDYFDWYTGDHNIPEDPKILIDIMEENLIYSFDLVGDTGEIVISNEGSTISIAGVSMIRHENELSILLLSGENPPNPPDEEINTQNINKSIDFTPGHENIVPDPDLSIQDRYLDGYKGFSKVLVLTRLDLSNKKHDVRYINIDMGSGYAIITDDLNALSGLTIKKRKTILEQSEKDFKRYDQLFSALASLIYLPIMFIAEADKVVDSKFVTSLFLNKKKHRVKKATKEFGRDQYHLHRIVKCMTSQNTDNLADTKINNIDPPEFSFESTGFWKPLEANQIGVDKNGNSVVGKTWVERVDTYKVSSPDSFIINNQPKAPQGIDPGIIYIVRSASHNIDIYKVGLTHREVNIRAKELGSTTGVPLPFEVLASWEVGNCGEIEKEIHFRLRKYRINNRREFFRVSLSTIVKTIGEVISETK